MKKLLIVDVPEGFELNDNKMVIKTKKVDSAGDVNFYDTIPCTIFTPPTDEDSMREANRLFEPLDSSFRQGEYSGFRFGFEWLKSLLQ